MCSSWHVRFRIATKPASRDDSRVVAAIFEAQMSREHNDANVLVMGERVIGRGVACDIVNTWLTTEFAGGRHQLRLNKI